MYCRQNLGVAHLPVGPCSDDLTLVRTVADSTEHCVGKDHLAANIAPAEKNRHPLRLC